MKPTHTPPALVAAILITGLSTSWADYGGLYFDGSNDHVSFGAAPSLGVTNFTVECWFKRTGAGGTASTGTGGITAVPLVTKGRGEADGDNRDMNWFLGFTTAGVLTADFEDRSTGLNHPSPGTTAASSNVWQHAAVTYQQAGNNGTWVVYLNGVPDKTNTFSGANPLVTTPRGDSIQHAALGSALTSSGTASGYFAGVMDEVRVWNYARSATEIAAAHNTQITSAAGLIARWSLDDSTGAAATNSVSGGANGTLLNGPLWTNGCFVLVMPPQVSLSSPANGSAVIGDWLALAATASASTGASVTNVEFYAGTAKVGEDGTAPYAMNWCDTAPGAYALTAVVQDSSGASATSAVVNVTLSAPLPSGALQFDGNNDYVTFGAAPELGLSMFTIECWFKRTGVGKATTTGNGGVTNALPLVTKGRGEAENSNVDMNWFLGISTNGNVLAADFEEGIGGSSLGLNHPVFGHTPLGNDVWYHAAATYDGGTWSLYLNGGLESNLVVLQPPRSDSIQHAALASALRSTGAAEGFFQGLLDEVRIWNYARSATEIADNYHRQITNQAGLVARWALNEGAGSVIQNAVCGGVNGSLVNGPAWATDSFDANVAPSVSLTNPANGTTISATAVTLEATASDPDGGVTNVQFFSGATLLGEDATEPYSFAWTGVAPGAYALLAVATDNLGLAATSAVVNVTVTPPPGVGGIYFEGVDDYVTMGAAQGLGVSNFTVECWFKQQGPGKRAYTGSSGIRAWPLVTRGMAENEAGATNMNFFFGLGTNDAGQTVLAADFEDMNNGLNHPVRGAALVASNAWQHGAVTYDVAGSNWVLYLNGVPDLTNIITGPSGITNELMLFPRFDSLQHAALGASLLSGGDTNADSGFFAGTLDEVRLWSYARSAQEIAEEYQAQIPSAPGLVARWSLDDGSGLAATNSGASAVEGALANGPVWVEGYAFTPAPVITSEPASQSVQCAENVSFTVGASGTALAYQWFRNASLLEGRTDDTLSLTNVSEADAGTYTVTVRNPGGTATSAPALLTVTDTNPPVIIVCATNQTLAADTTCQAAIPDLTPQVVASDSCTAVTVSQSPTAGTLVGLGDHPVALTVSDAATNQAACVATITVVDGNVPVITAQPQSQTFLVGSTVSFTVVATSCSPLGYQWSLGTTALPGETLPTLTLTNLQPAQAGEYSVVLTNSAGGATSQVAVLTVQLPAAPILVAGPAILPNGHLSAAFSGTPDVAYTVEFTDQLGETWQTLTNLAADGAGLIVFEDQTSPAPAQRFYRVVYP